MLTVWGEGFWFLANSLPAGNLSAKELSYFLLGLVTTICVSVQMGTIFFLGFLSVEVSVYETCPFFFFYELYKPKSVVVSSLLATIGLNSGSWILHLSESEGDHLFFFVLLFKVVAVLVQHITLWCLAFWSSKPIV